MRALKRDQKTFYYALYGSKEPVLDDDGYETGDYEIVYSEPVPFMASISPSRGKADEEQFGVNADYDRTLITFDTSIPFKETTKIFIDSDMTVEHPIADYKITNIAISNSSVTIAIKKIPQNEE